MEHHFGRGHSYSLGVEEEFQLVSRESFELVSRVDEILSDKGMVRIITTIFGRPTPLELEYWQIEKI